MDCKTVSARHVTHNQIIIRRGRKQKRKATSDCINITFYSQWMHVFHDSFPNKAIIYSSEVCCVAFSSAAVLRQDTKTNDRDVCRTSWGSLWCPKKASKALSHRGLPPLSTPPLCVLHGLPTVFPFVSVHSLNQPGVSGCFLFHVSVILTGPRPNESFPLRYGEKITFRVLSERPLQHEAHSPCVLCGGARHRLCTCVHATGPTRTHTDTERWLMLCAPCCILYFTGSFLAPWSHKLD